jgi:hypothetical protein
MINNLMIDGEDFNITTHQGTGIGSGWVSPDNPGTLRADNLMICGGDITCKSLGGGSVSDSSYVDTISIIASVVLNVLDSAVNASQILLSHVKLITAATATRLFGVTPNVSGEVDLTLLYTTTYQLAVEPFANIAALELGSLNLPRSENWTLQVLAKHESWAKSFPVDSSPVKRCFVTVAAAGKYGGLAASRVSSGYLQNGSFDTFAIQRSTMFLPEVHVIVTSRSTEQTQPASEHSFVSGHSTLLQSSGSQPRRRCSVADCPSGSS